MSQWTIIWTCWSMHYLTVSLWSDNLIGSICDGICGGDYNTFGGKDVVFHRKCVHLQRNKHITLIKNIDQ